MSLERRIERRRRRRIRRTVSWHARSQKERE
jgi:hypothetical protein